MASESKDASKREAVASRNAKGEGKEKTSA